MKTIHIILASALLAAGCGEQADRAPDASTSGYLLSGTVMAVAYSGFREGQHPDRGDGAVAFGAHMPPAQARVDRRGDILPVDRGRRCAEDGTGEGDSEDG